MTTSIVLVKGLSQCEDSVKAMNLRALLANSKCQEEILKATWGTILDWLDQIRSGLSNEEALRFRATLMKVKDDTSWYNHKLLGEFL